MYVGVYVCLGICVCMHNIIPCFKIEIVCICVQSFTNIIIKYMELNI
jgi:hypothetical protein